MIIDVYKDYTCREATLEDIPSMYGILEPLVCDYNNHYTTVESNKRQLRNNLVYYIENEDSLVIERNSEIVGVYIGAGNFIRHIANKYNDVRSMALLFYNVLCKLHSRIKESEFVPLKHIGAYKFPSKLFGKEAIRYEGNKAYITLYTKDKLEYLYNKLIRV